VYTRVIEEYARHSGHADLLRHRWVDRIEFQTAPWWWQPPFPVT
jgi:hypothetical protein